MAQVEIIRSLFEEIQRRFKGEAQEIIDLLETLGENPHKGKLLGNIGAMAIKELKYENFRFYFIVEGYKLRFFDEESLKDLLIRFVRMSGKKDQQKTINQIRDILRKVGVSGF